MDLGAAFYHYQTARPLTTDPCRIGRAVGEHLTCCDRFTSRCLG